MRTHKEIRLAVLLLLGLQALTAVGGIVLLGRLEPVVDRVLEDNDFSLLAAADAEAVLVEHRGALDGPAAAALEGAVVRLARNVTEEDEPQRVAALEQDLPAVVAGDGAARRRFHESLRALAKINRDAMHAANERASRLARAGAWSLVVLALATLTVGVIVMGRARRRLIEPLDRVMAVVQAWRQGDRLRRTGGLGDEAADLATVAAVLDELLDLVASSAPRVGPDQAGPLRTALLALLEARPGPAAVVDADGGLVAANRAAFDHLGEVGRALQGEVPATITDLGSGVRLVEQTTVTS